jgi:hypothetical protein
VESLAVRVVAAGKQEREVSVSCPEEQQELPVPGLQGQERRRVEELPQILEQLHQSRLRLLFRAMVLQQRLLRLQLPPVQDLILEQPRLEQRPLELHSEVRQ